MGVESEARVEGWGWAGSSPRPSITRMRSLPEGEPRGRFRILVMPPASEGLNVPKELARRNLMKGKEPC